MKPPAILHIAVRSVDRLLDIESSPLAGPGIHPEVARAIRAEATVFKRGTAFQIEVEVPEAETARQEEVATAIRTHFIEELAEVRDELRTVSHKARWTFALAFVAVALIIMLSEFVLLLGDGRFFEVLGESLVIVAWVTLWGPTEMLLFARFPLIRQRNLADALARAPVSLVATARRQT